MLYANSKMENWQPRKYAGAELTEIGETHCHTLNGQS